MLAVHLENGAVTLRDVPIPRRPPGCAPPPWLAAVALPLGRIPALWWFSTGPAHGETPKICFAGCYLRVGTEIAFIGGRRCEMRKLMLLAAAFVAMLPYQAVARGRVGVFIGAGVPFGGYGGGYGPYFDGPYGYAPYAAVPHAGQV